MTRVRTRWAAALFIVLGALIAMWVIIHGLGDDSGTQEEGTIPAEHGAAAQSSPGSGS